MKPAHKGKDPRQAELAKIHILAKQCGLDDEARREMYLAQVGKASAADMSPLERRRVLAHLVKAAGGKGAGTRKSGDAGKTGSRERLQAKVEAIKADLGLTDHYLDVMAKKITGVDTWKWCDAGQLHKLVAALTYHQRRKAKEAV